MSYVNCISIKLGEKGDYNSNYIIELRICNLNFGRNKGILGIISFNARQLINK